MNDYPQVIDESPLHIYADKLHEAVNRYYDDPIADRVALTIAGYANSNGVAFPGFKLLESLTGYTYEEISRATHRIQALGIWKISRRRRKGAPYAHDVYKFCKRFIREVIDICSAHFIANVQKWKAEAKDVADAVKTTAKKAIDDLVEQAAKMAAVFQEQPELLESPELAAGIAGTATIPSVSDAMPGLVQAGAESADEWLDAARPVKGENAPLASESLRLPSPLEPAVAPRVYASWRDRVAAYRKDIVTA